MYKLKKVSRYLVENYLLLFSSSWYKLYQIFHTQKKNREIKAIKAFWVELNQKRKKMKNKNRGEIDGKMKEKRERKM